MTLRDSIELLREENIEVAINTGETAESVKELVEYFRASSLDAEEERRERQSRSPVAVPGAPTTGVPNAPEDTGGGLGGFGTALTLLIGLPSAILGFAKGVAQSWMTGVGKVIKSITKVITNEFKLFTTFVSEKFNFRGTILDDIVKSISDFTMRIKQGVQLLVDDVKKFLKPIGDVGKSIKSGFETFYIYYLLFKDKIKATFKPVGDAIQSAINAFKGVSDTTTSAGSIFSKISEPVKAFFLKVKSFSSGIFKAFAGLGKILGWPVTVIGGVIAGLMDSFEKFKVGDILGGAIAFVTGALNFAIFSIVDLIKDGISWISSYLFGADNPVTKFLDSFSFEGLFTDYMQGVESFYRAIPEAITNIVNGISDWFSGLMESEDPLSYLMEPINQFIQDIKDFVVGLVPDISGLVGQGIDAVTDFFSGFGGDTTTPPQQTAPDAPVPDVPVSDVPNFVPSAESNTTTNTTNNETNNTTNNNTVSSLEKRVEVAERQVKIAERKYAENPTDTRKQILEKRVATVDKLKERIEKPVVVPQIEKLSNTSETNVIERPVNTMRTMKGQEAQEESKENAQMKAEGQTSVNVIAPNTSNTTNNNSSTAAVIDKNVPTVDYNDRFTPYISWI